MPLANASYGTRPVQAYLRGLLPDNAAVRSRWAQNFGLRDGDTFGLIAAIGLDCAGAAVFAPETDWRVPTTRENTLEPATEHDIAERLRAIRLDGAAWHGSDGEHWSLAGGQSKFTLTRTSGGWAWPRGAAASTHIVKPGIGYLPAQALVEHVSMRALTLAGESVAESRFLMFEDEPAIVVRRFDRFTGPDGTVKRIHSEDALQALGLDPARKYESDHGPGIAAIVALLHRVADQTSVDRFIRAQITGYLLGAPDGHAKNYSLLLIGPAAALAPLYDVASGLASTATDGGLRYPKVAMSIGGQTRIGEAEAREWDKFAHVVGWPPEKVRSTVQELTQTLPDTVSQAAGELPPGVPGRDVVTDQLVPRVAALAERTKRGLNESARVGGRIVAPFGRVLGGIGTAA
jgi:serine/threonine-protein kinase HipA